MFTQICQLGLPSRRQISGLVEYVKAVNLSKNVAAEIAAEF